MSDELTRWAAGRPVSASDASPSQIGRYRILRIIAEGGMGTVYEAEQENPRRTVALKVIRPGVASPSVLLRFEQESQVLARLQHPGIAQIYEAATADEGRGLQPYLAMEFVRGRALDEYADERRLGSRERLDLVTRICDAVEHAHQKGVIHRDLKPANILVDDSGQPKILDFGIARVTDSDLQITMNTDLGQIIGTLPYMSPEQVAGNPAELDTRSDVYSLGVILYQLLAGRLPYDVKKKHLTEGVRIIREEEPTRLSSVSRTFRGDIETIVAKALSKEKEQRYQSAGDLASDIRRYLRDEPIVARPPSTTYQLRKFARRNRALVGGLAAAFVVLVLGVVVSSWQAVRATRAEGLATSRLAETQEARALAETRQQESDAARRLAEERRTEAETQKAQADQARVAETEQRLSAESSAERARQETAKAEAVNRFLQDMLSSVNPSEMKGRDVTVRQVLDEAAKKVREGSLANQPEMEAAVSTTLGKTYQALGLYAEAEPYLRAALDTRRKILRPDHLEVAASMHNLASLLHDRGDMAGAESLYREALGIQRQFPGAELELSSTLNDLGLLLSDQEDLTGAEPLYRESLAIKRKLLGDGHPDLAQALHNLAALLRYRGDLDGAESMYREALSIRRRTLGEEHPDVAQGLNNLAALLQSRGDLDGAESMYREAVSIRRRALGDQHPDLAVSLHNLATVLRLRGDLAGAEPLHRESLAIWRQTLGDEHPNVASALSNLAVLLQARGDLDGAEPLQREALAIRRKVLNSDSPDVAHSLNGLGSLLVEKGDLAEAEPMLRESLAIRTRKLPARDPGIASSLAGLGFCLVRQGRHAEAESLLVAALSIREEKLPAGHWGRFDTKSLLGEALAGQKKFEEAEPLLLEAYEGLKNDKAVPATAKRAAQERIERLYAAWGRPDRAAAWRASLEK